MLLRASHPKDAWKKQERDMFFPHEIYMTSIHYSIEAIFVGAYCVAIFFALIQVLPIKNPLLFLFIFGFVKHFMGHLFKIHDYYCKCKGTIGPRLLLESVGEGILFMTIGQIPFFNITSPLSFFCAGFSLHILFEWLGLHRLFCEKRCLGM